MKTYYNDSETAILQSIRLALGKRSDVLMFRNNTGALKDINGRLVRFGLGPGSSDLIGFVVRGGLCLFCAIEVKAPGGARSPAQARFIQIVRDAGGLAGFAESVEDAMRIVDAN